MNNERQKIMSRVTALLERTVERGCTESEALLAAEKAGQLMNHYNITMGDITAENNPCRHVCIEQNTIRATAIQYAVVAIARFTDTKCWFSRGQKGYQGEIIRKASFNFFGLEEDVAVAEYMFHLINRSMHRCTDDFKQSEAYRRPGSKKRRTLSFQYAFTGRICDRLNEMKDSMEEAVERERAAQGTNTGTALVLVKGDYVDEQFEKQMTITLTRRTNQRRAYDHDAARAGRAAGDSVGLNPGVGSRAQALLT